MNYAVTIAGRTVEIAVDGDQVTIDRQVHRAELVEIPGTPMRQLLLDGRSVALPILPAGRGEWELSLAGDHWPAEVVDERTRHIRSLTGSRGGKAGPPVLKAPMPGLVVRVLVEPGQEVAAGAGLVVLEAMKMENELKAPAPGRIRSISAQPGQPVDKGAVLVEFEGPAGDGTA